MIIFTRSSSKYIYGRGAINLRSTPPVSSLCVFAWQLEIVLLVQSALPDIVSADANSSKIKLSVSGINSEFSF